MNVLIACEESQEVCKAFRAVGHEAYSCDIQPCSGGHPEWHIQTDVREILNPIDYGNNYLPAIWFSTVDGEFHEVEQWDLVIAHPPCTDLAVSGARWFKEKRESGVQQKSIEFFMEFTRLSCAWAIENPVGIMSTIYRKPDQIIQPWMFGDNFSKSTCLWLKGLQPLIPVVTEKPELEYFEWIDKKTGKKKRQPKWFADAWKLSPAERSRVRSKTFPGIAKAMAEQWGVN